MKTLLLALVFPFLQLTTDPGKFYQAPFALPGKEIRVPTAPVCDIKKLK